MFCVTRKSCFNVAVGIVLFEVIVAIWYEFELPIPFHESSSSRSVQKYGYRDDEPAESFLIMHLEYCKQNLIPNPSNVPATYGPYDNSSFCQCVPDELAGRIDIVKPVPQHEKLPNYHFQVQSGGVWSPSDCLARHRVAIIIPFRDRSDHLRTLLHVLHPMLQRQRLHYTIYVVEQGKPDVFNKAALMNAGFVEASKQFNYDCYIFHDVDMLPEDDRNMYICMPLPRHVGSHLAQWDYRVPYAEIFGGVTAFTKEQFVKVNGFSNQYYGWGGEDDDMFKRVKAQGYSVVRFPREIARYTMIKHGADHRNPFNIRSSLGYLSRPRHYTDDGLTSLRYECARVESRPLYTWLLIDLPDPPTNFKSLPRHSLASGIVTPECLICILLLCTLVQYFC